MPAMDAGASEHRTQALPAPAVRKGPWTAEEDNILVSNIAAHGEGSWNNLARAAGLSRTGKSCRLRWLNYLRPDLRRGGFTTEEEELISRLQARWGNKWSRIAKHLPAGRTDNEVKNFWRTKIQKKNRSRNAAPSRTPHVERTARALRQSQRARAAVAPARQGSLLTTTAFWSRRRACLAWCMDSYHQGYDVVHAGGDASGGAMNCFFPGVLGRVG